MTGQTLAHYELGSLLGEGGSGVVYRGRDLRLDREVAVKVLAAALREDELAWARLLREARLASKLSHPNIAVIHDLGEENERAYVVMEYVEGLRLSDLIPDEGMPFEQFTRYTRQICEALAFAHEHGTLHGDLKGSNIMVTAGGMVKLLDFGLGRRIPRVGNPDVSSNSISLTDSGVTAGTLPYLAPEVLRGEPTSLQSDVWSLGVLFYQMATGEFPFSGSTPFDLSVGILTVTPNLEKLSEPTRSAVEGALEKIPEKRISSVRELLLKLQKTGTRTTNGGQGRHQENRSGSTGGFRGFLRQRKWIVGVTSIGLGVLMAAGILFHHARPSLPPEKVLASSESRKGALGGIENPNAKVWVNTDSGTYHCAGTRWYGKTHAGEYMMQKDARVKGYHPAESHPCY